MIEVKDEILDTTSQLDENPRYTLRKNNGDVIQDDVQILLKTPRIQEGTPINKKLFGTIEKATITYNLLDDYTDYSLGESIRYDNTGYATMSLTACAYVNAIELDDGNIMIISNNTDLSTYLCYQIRDRQGNTIVQATALNSTASTNIKAVKMDNGNIFIAYTASSVGKYIIINQAGAALIPESILGTKSGNNYHIDLKKLPDGNVLAAYYNSNDTDAMATLYDESGKRLIHSVFADVSASSAGRMHISLKKNGQILINYNNSYCILDKNLAPVNSGAIEGLSGTTYAAVEEMDNGDYICAAGGADATYYHILDSEFNIKKVAVLNSLGNAWDLKMCKVKDGSFFIIYTDDDNNDVYYSVVDKNGNFAVNNFPAVSGGRVNDVSCDMLDDGTVFYSSHAYNTTITYGKIVGKKEETYERKYLIKDIGVPQELQKINVKGYNKLPAEKISSKDSYDKKSMVAIKLSDGNVLSFYGSNGKFYFSIYDEELNIVLPETFVATGNVVKADVKELPNGNIVFAFCGVSNTYYGKFVIYDKNGNIVKAETTFRNVNTSRMEIQILDNNNFMIIFLNGSTYSINFVIYDQNGNMVQDTTNLCTLESMNSINDIRTKRMTNGNIFISWNIDTSSVATLGDLHYMIIDQSGAVVKTNVALEQVQIISFDLAIMDDRNIFILSEFRQGGNKYYIINEAGEIVETNIADFGFTMKYPSLIALENGNISIIGLPSGIYNNPLVTMYIYSQGQFEYVSTLKSQTLYNKPATCQLNNSNIFVLYCGKEETNVTRYTLNIQVISDSGERYDYLSIMSNTINDIEVDTLLEPQKYYELVYENDIFIAKEVRK